MSESPGDYRNNLLAEGRSVLNSRIPSGHRRIYDRVDSMLFHKWVNCVSYPLTAFEVLSMANHLCTMVERTRKVTQ